MYYLLCVGDQDRLSAMAWLAEELPREASDH